MRQDNTYLLQLQGHTACVQSLETT